MRRELKRIQKELGPTFAFVTHDQEEAMAMADRVAVMHRGRIVQIGTASEPHDAFLRCAGAVVVAGAGNAALFVAWPRRA
ncbi:hypothetical protein AB0D40_31505 [Streptomyces massasporeus]|uniref:hypothetical protein n=1 Tax=Streptomyces massasporeus TaxID=67324 RepID=UPI0034042027